MGRVSGREWLTFSLNGVAGEFGGAGGGGGGVVVLGGPFGVAARGSIGFVRIVVDHLQDCV